MKYSKLCVVSFRARVRDHFSILIRVHNRMRVPPYLYLVLSILLFLYDSVGDNTILDVIPRTNLVTACFYYRKYWYVSFNMI